MHSLVLRALNRIRRQVPRRMLPVRGRADSERLGSTYGGWIVPVNLLSQGSICWCAGVGEDITFDLAMIERFGCNVWAFDPTPRAVCHVTSHAAHEPRYHFVPVGLWSEDATMRFFAPRNADYVSHSIVNLQGTKDGFDAPCRSVATLMKELGHERIDLLKLDVEGAEYAVLESLDYNEIRPRILCVEFDQPSSLRKILAASRGLMASGYELVAVDGWNFTFVRS